VASFIVQLHEASLAKAGLGKGCPGAGGTGVRLTLRCAGSEGTCMDLDASWMGCIIEVLRAGTVSGVGMASPVGGAVKTGIVMLLRPGGTTPERVFCCKCKVVK
jgi:hypothetical protein